MYSSVFLQCLPEGVNSAKKSFSLSFPITHHIINLKWKGSKKSLYIYSKLKQSTKIVGPVLKRASLIAQLAKNPPAMRETPVQFLGWQDPLEKGELPTPVFLGFPWGSAGKESTCNMGDLGQALDWEDSPGEGKGYPLQYSDWRIAWTK